MKSNREIIWIVLVLVTLILVCGSSTFASGETEAGMVENTISEEMQADDEEMNEPEPTDIQTVTIIGTVAVDYVLVSKQGVVYGITETEAGDVMGQYVGEEVIVKGIISEVDDEKLISVISFGFVESLQH